MVLEKSNNFKDIEEMYYEYFPKAELKDVTLLQSLIFENKASLLLFKKQDKIAAFAFVYDSGEFCLIDYLAVNKSERGGGVGGEMLKKIKHHYSNKKGVALEIEALNKGESESDNKIRARRKQFYLRNGVLETGLGVVLNEVEMEVLLLPALLNKITKQEYLKIYYETFTKEFADGYVRM